MSKTAYHPKFNGARATAHSCDAAFAKVSESDVAAQREKNPEIQLSLLITTDRAIDEAITACKGDERQQKLNEGKRKLELQIEDVQDRVLSPLRVPRGYRVRGNSASLS